MNKQPILILTLCFILGIFLQDYFSFDKNIVFVLLSIGFLSGFLLFFQSYFIAKFSSIFISIFFLSLGVFLHYFNTKKPSNLHFQSNENVTFKISKKLNSNEKYKKYEIESQIGESVFSSILYISKDKENLDFRNYYKAKAYVSEVKSPEYDFQFDYAKYLHRKNIYHQVFVKGELLSAPRNDLSISEKIRQKRIEVLYKINQTDLSPKSQEFLKGIILADRTEIDSATTTDFNRSGLVHFLAISGTHVVVIFGMIYYLMMKILPVGSRKWVVVFSLLFIWIFALFIGFGNSVVRSCVMLSLHFVYVLLQRKPDLLHSLALSALLILVMDTQQIFDVGFQLSFVAVLGIFWLNKPILNYLPKQDNYFKKIIYNTISISIAAQIATLPLVLYYFHQFSLISIVANFFIVPFSEVIIVFSFVMTGLIAFGLDFSILNAGYDFMIQILLKIIHWFANFDVLYFENIPLNLIEVAILFVLLYLLRTVVNRCDIKNFAIFSAAILCFFILRISFTIYENRKEEVIVFHQKKNNFICIKKNNKAYFWISDAVEKQSIKQFFINPYLSSRRIKYATISNLPASSHRFVFESKTYDLK